MTDPQETPETEFGRMIADAVGTKPDLAAELRRRFDGEPEPTDEQHQRRQAADDIRAALDEARSRDADRPS
ncbi:hypothetical protein [Saccharopolyspora pogona]|uniref:hypothetical protein n=1 Tax=Saccharopolyspora pogona TaxID=333966 RepID=UPI001685055E|nr:hypothetical protein [Saccharopolyspora pogona]